MVDRIRGTTLQNIRRAHFKQHPLCVMCLAKQRTTLATELDHIRPLHKGGTDTPDNRQGLCEDCHLEKSKLERGHAYRPKQRIGADGWPECE
jgi:5-methylcytosine-specific restriction enzyme A